MIICQQAQAKNSYIDGTASQFQRAIDESREYESCLQTMLMGVSASSSATAQSPKMHNLPQAKSSSSHSDDPTKRGGGCKNESGNEGVKRLMSGLSLAMANEGDQMMVGQNIPNAQTDDSKYEPEEGGFCILPGSPATRAAFHGPPPLHPDDIHWAKLQASPFSVPGPSGSKTTKVLNGLMEDVMDITSSPALPSLIQRCSAEGSPRLKLFQRKQCSNATIKDQLSDLRSFGVTL